MGYFYQDWKEKKMFVENADGQYVMNFGESEKGMIENLESAIIMLTEGASDEKRMALNSVEKLIAEKKAIVTAFEKEFADDTQQAA